MIYALRNGEQMLVTQKTFKLELLQQIILDPITALF